MVPRDLPALSNPLSSPKIACAMMTITRATDLSAPGCDLIRQWLREHNREVNPTFMELLGQAAHQAQPLILLNHSGPDVTGGLFAETQLSWLMISIMAVAPE